MNNWLPTTMREKLSPFWDTQVAQTDFSGGNPQKGGMRNVTETQTLLHTFHTSTHCFTHQLA